MENYVERIKSRWPRSEESFERSTAYWLRQAQLDIAYLLKEIEKLRQEHSQNK